MPSPLLVRPCRSLGGTFEVSLPVTVSSAPTSRPRSWIPALLGFARLVNEKVSPPPRSIGPGRLTSTASPGIRESFRPLPLHRPHPRCSPSQGVSTLSESSCRRSRAPTSSFLTTSPAFTTDCPDFTGLSITLHGDGGLAGLLHPAANPGVRCVLTRSPGVRRPRERPHRCARSLPVTERALAPHRCSYPSKDPPPLQPVRVSAHLCLPGLLFTVDPRPPRHRRFQHASSWSYRRRTGPPRLCSARQSVPSTAVFGRSLACPSWAWSPSRSPSSPFLRSDRMSRRPAPLSSSPRPTVASMSLPSVVPRDRSRVDERSLRAVLRPARSRTESPR